MVYRRWISSLPPIALLMVLGCSGDDAASDSDTLGGDVSEAGTDSSASNASNASNASDGTSGDTSETEGTETTGEDTSASTGDDDTGGDGQATMCAVILDDSDTAVEAFCEAGNLGDPCIGHPTTCTNADSASTYRDEQPGLAKYPWYQAAILWARENDHRRVEVDPGTIDVNEASAVPTPTGKVGFFVPSHIDLRGSTDLDAPTVLINTDTNPNPGSIPPPNRVQAMVMVSEDTYEYPEGHDHHKDMYRAPTSDTTISYLQISGVAAPPSDCDSRSLSLESITDTDEFTPDPPTIYDRSEIQAYFGILVDRTDGENGNVDLHHLIVAHVEMGIQLGWANFGLKADPSCQTTSCVRLFYAQPVNGQCAQGNYRYLDVLGAYTCIIEGAEPNCVRNYCPMGRFLYEGGETDPGVVHNSSFCDADQGVSGAYASNVDIYRNFMLEIRPTPNGYTNAGIWGYTNSSIFDNYITSGDFCYAAEGSNFPNVDVETWKQVTGYYPTDPGISGDDYQILGQYIVGDANDFFLDTDPYGAWGTNNDFTYNKCVDFARSGVALVRQNYTWVGANQMSGTGPGNSLEGVFLLDAMNTFVYGNTISDTTTGVWVYGFPGYGSPLGSINNSCYQYYDLATNTYMDWPNSFNNVTTIWDIGAGSVCLH